MIKIKEIIVGPYFYQWSHCYFNRIYQIIEEREKKSKKDGEGGFLTKKRLPGLKKRLL